MLDKKITSMKDLLEEEARLCEEHNRLIDEGAPISQITNLRAVIRMKRVHVSATMSPTAKYGVSVLREENDEDE